MFKTFIHSTLIVIISISFFSGCKKPTKEVVIDLNEITIAEIHQAYTEGNYTSEDLVKAYMDRIEDQDEKINAITFINPEALDVARKLDEEFKSTGKLRPLHGIPIIVKDNINTLGIPTTAGSKALKNYMPSENAFIIEKLQNAGAIVLAKSNMAEWAFSAMHSESSTSGITRNPYNTNHVPAGSSGGTGASVAANFGAAGLGTDTGNSIRGPSSHCSLVGFRTTLGLISRSGIVPLYLRNDVVGPMCRTVEDATRILNAMTGFDPTDPITSHSEGKIQGDYVQYLDKNGLKNARIGVLRELSEDDPDPEIKVLFENALLDLKKQGAILIDPFVVPGFSELRQNQWCADFKKDIEQFLVDNVKNDTIKTLQDIIRIGSNSEYTTKRVLSFAENSGRWDETDLPCGDAYTDNRRVAFRQAIENLMDSLQLDAVVYPTWNHKPALIDSFATGYKGDNNQIIAPHTGQPAFTVPMGFTTGNLPVGIQFLGRMFDEPTLIKLAYSYEQGTLHRKPPELSTEK